VLSGPSGRRGARSRTLLGSPDRRAAFRALPSPWPSRDAFTPTAMAELTV